MSKLKRNIPLRIFIIFGGYGVYRLSVGKKFYKHIHTIKTIG